MQMKDYKFGEKDDAFFVIFSVAKNLKEKGVQLWNPDTLEKQNLFNKLQSNEIITGYIDNKVVAAMTLTFYDPEFWPEIKQGDSSFIHKLSVLPEYQGFGIAKQMVDFADSIAHSKGVKFSRLDCASDRPKLCNFYEELGYEKVKECIVGMLPTAFYERRI
jgi:GNAT superfamily N-acetyltransferase